MFESRLNIKYIIPDNRLIIIKTIGVRIYNFETSR